jgi:2-phosphoglycerate kinase
MNKREEKYPAIVRYNELWEHGQISNPVVFLIGGYAGTGKSTLVKEIASFFTNINVLPTGIIRSVLRGYVTEEDNPYLYSHTYDLHTFLDDLSDNDTVSKLYEQQIGPVSKSINKIIDFASTEKQHWILEGNHIFPRFIKPSNAVILFEIYLQVTDSSMHRKMISSSTHNRKFTDIQFNTARTLHDYTVQKVKRHEGLLFEYDVATQEVLTLINKTLASYLQNHHA